MFTARVLGTVVATRKDEKLAGKRLLIVAPLDTAGRQGKSLVAVDLIGAGSGEVVALCRARDAAMVAGDGPVDAAIVGIVDEMTAPPPPPLDLRSLGFHGGSGE